MSFSQARLRSLSVVESKLVPAARASPGCRRHPVGRQLATLAERRLLVDHRLLIFADLGRALRGRSLLRHYVARHLSLRRLLLYEFGQPRLLLPLASAYRRKSTARGVLTVLLSEKNELASVVNAGNDLDCPLPPRQGTTPAKHSKCVLAAAAAATLRRGPLRRRTGRTSQTVGVGASALGGRVGRVAVGGQQQRAAMNEVECTVSDEAGGLGRLSLRTTHGWAHNL